MLNPNSPTLDKVIGNIVEEVLRERAEQENKETPPMDEVREEMEIEVEAG